jgi:hypothetical protein
MNWIRAIELNVLMELPGLVLGTLAGLLAGRLLWRKK